MTRGNQRDKRRAEVQKANGGAAKKTVMSGAEMAKSKESAAEIMRRKQAAADAKKEADGKK